MQINIQSNTLLQSKYLFLQAAGSLGTDGSLQGIHLRWELLNSLGEKHLPKGNLGTNTGDTVKVYRSRYMHKYPVIVDVYNQSPSIVVDNSLAVDIEDENFTSKDRIWIYQGDKVNTNDVVYLYFKDRVKYDSITIDPLTNHVDFIEAYGSSLIEARVKNKLCFASNIYLTNIGQDPELKLETISTNNDETVEKPIFVSSRKIFDKKTIGTPTPEPSFLLQEDDDYVLQENKYKLYLEDSPEIVNLLQNGDFELGNTGFTSDYAMPISTGNASYEIIENAQTVNPLWTGIPVSGTKFMAIQSANSTSSCIYKQTALAVDSNTTYSFSGCLSILETIDISEIPQITVRITGIQTQEQYEEIFEAPEVTGIWKFFELIWNSKTNTTATVEIFAATTVQQGKVFGLDNLLFTTSAIQNFARIMTENIQSVRFTIQDALLSELRLETYDNYIANINAVNSWQEIGEQGGFGLSLDTTTVYNRLEKTPNTIHNKWQKYKGGTVNIRNYEDRWIPSSGDMGVQHAISEYIRLSNDPNNPKANVDDEKADGGTKDGSGAISISYFDMLKMISYDYHAARMLGLGYIDEEVGANQKNEYIYAVEYTSRIAIEEGTGISHVFLTTPITVKQEKRPKKPTLLPFTYGIIQNEGTEDELLITDSKGYTFDGKARFISINVDANETIYQTGNFFAQSNQFCFQGETESLFMGIEYKHKNETKWKQEAIAHDSFYKEFNSPTFEASQIPVPIDSNLLFRHKETESGEHDYAVYSINWFSRTSSYSNSLRTDETKFEKPNKLQPPQNLHAQVIQKEDNLLLTTSSEQALLNAITTADKTLVRITFEYTHTHDLTHNFADSVQLYYRTKEPRSVTGLIKTVEVLNSKQSKITTTKYEHPTIDKKVITYTGIVPTADYDRYIGGVLTVKDRVFIIEKVEASSITGDGSTFIVTNIDNRKAAEANTTEENVKSSYVHTKSIITPKDYEKQAFTIIENLANVENWSNNTSSPTPLSCEVQLSDFGHANAMWSQEETEEIVPMVWDEEHGINVPGVKGEDVSYFQKIRGINDSATINKKLGFDGETENVHIGVYTVTFLNKIHRAHPQSTEANPVDWYKGSIRVHTSVNPDGEKKVLEVLQILSTVGNPLSLLVFDADYKNEPIQEGLLVKVNYYPGYKLYMYADSNSGLIAENIFPKANEGTRVTYLAARTLDKNYLTINGDVYSSKIGKPVTLPAFEIQEPVTPEKPIGGRFATRPDFYNKATYTFQVKCKSENPYALAFYRASDRMILEAIYESETIAEIETALEGLGDDAFYTSRWENLLDFDAIVSDPNKAFTTYSGYRFPKPNKQKDKFGKTLFNGNQEAGVVIDKYKTAIYSVFLSLTEQPLLYSYIKSASNYIPSNKKQTIRDEQGDLLAFTDPKFDQSPMAKIVNVYNKVVQFTDFTLDGASKNFYFYCAMEISNRMQFSEKSPIFGPIQLVNTSAPTAPKIVNIKSILEDTYQEIPTSVVIQVSNYIKIQGITKFQLYRTTLATEAMSIRSMKMVQEIDLETLNLLDESTIEIVDDFHTEDYLPYGEALFYKVIALRKIKYANQLGEEIIDYVPSIGSKTVMANIVDTVNPVAPILAFTSDELADGLLPNCKLSWQKVTHNATYYVYKMNDSGNWNLLDSFRNNNLEIEYKLEDSLSKVDEDNQPIYHRFKVDVENSSGLWNFNDNTITI